MVITDTGICEVCNENPAKIICDGCGKKLCLECRTFDIWCYGCGHADTKAFCLKCYINPEINLWKIA
jgi:hypothetical protein